MCYSRWCGIWTKSAGCLLKTLGVSLVLSRPNLTREASFWPNPFLVHPRVLESRARAVWGSMFWDRINPSDHQALMRWSLLSEHHLVPPLWRMTGEFMKPKDGLMLLSHWFIIRNKVFPSVQAPSVDSSHDEGITALATWAWAEILEGLHLLMWPAGFNLYLVRKHAELSFSNKVSNFEGVIYPGREGVAKPMFPKLQ